MRLVYMTDGGDVSIGFKHTEETILKLKEIAKQRAKNNQYINTLKEYGLKQWENKTENEKLLNKLNQKGRRNIKQFTLDGIFDNRKFTSNVKSSILSFNAFICAVYVICH